MTPIVDGLEEEFAGQLTVSRLNAADPETVQLQQAYGLRGHPSFAVVDGNGTPSQIFVGLQSEDDLRDAIINMLGQLEGG